MDPVQEFDRQNEEHINQMGKDVSYLKQSQEWMNTANQHEYAYHFKWMGRPIIQYPQDIMAIQEIIWEVRPDIVIETGIAHGGSIIFSASILELIGHGEVVAVDVDIRDHNRQLIEEHPMNKRIRMIQGNSIDEAVIQQVRSYARGKQKIMVCLDSNHTHEHVLKELEAYAPLVTKGSYLLVLDTVIEDFPAEASKGRPWGIGNNPKTAVREYLKTTNRFEWQKNIENKMGITVAPEGYYKCVKEL